MDEYTPDQIMKTKILYYIKELLDSATDIFINSDDEETINIYKGKIRALTRVLFGVQETTIP